MSELPQGWAETTLGTVIDYGATCKAEPDEISEDSWILELEDIEKNASKIIGRFTFSERKSKSTKNRFLRGDVLYGKLRPYLNKVVIADADGYCTTEIIPIKQTQVTDNRYVFYWLKHPRFLDYVTEVSHGLNMPRLGTDAGKKAPFVLAPHPEQKRISDKLDILLARVDATRERLDRIPALLKRFRQSVLAAASSGQLTENWRQERNAEDAREILGRAATSRDAAGVRFRGGPARRPELSDLPLCPELPRGWVATCFDELAEANRNALKAGPFGSALKKDMYVPKGHKIYGQEQVISGDESFGDYYISDEKYLELESCAVKPGDILISLVGTIGKVLVLSEHSEKGIINPRLVKLGLHKDVSRRYIACYLQSEYSQLFFREKSHGGTMDVLNLGLLRELPVLLPPVPEQNEIVRRVEALFALADKLEARYTTARAKVDKLTPALLAKAFRGELVPQDPNDEPAEQLLARIRTAREAAPASAKKSRKPLKAKEPA